MTSLLYRQPPDISGARPPLLYFIRHLPLAICQSNFLALKKFDTTPTNTIGS